MNQISIENKTLTVSDAVREISRYKGPDEGFLGHLIHIQTKLINAQAAIIIRANENQKSIIASTVKSNEEAWQLEAIKKVQELDQANKAHLQVAEINEKVQQLLYMPVLGEDRKARGYAVYLCNNIKRSNVNDVKESVRITLSLLPMYESRLSLKQEYEGVDRLKMALEMLITCNKEHKFKSQAIAICNEIAVRWKCNRVSIGMLKGRYVKTIAISNCEKFNRKMALIQDLETAMEECLDQDREILYPSPQNADYVSRSSEQFCKKHITKSILSIPLRKDGNPIAIITLEAKEGKPFTENDLDVLRLASELVSSRFFELEEKDKWFGAKLLVFTKKAFGVIVGPKYTWVKLGSVAVTAAIVFLCLARGQYTIDPSFILSPQEKHMRVAPFNAEIESVKVKSNDYISDPNMVLATLETSELKLERLAKMAQVQELETKITAARRDKEWAQSKILSAEVERIKVEIELLELKINQSVIRAGTTGYIVSKDINQMIGAPVSKGDLLFEIVPGSNHEAELYVPEDQINDLEKAMAEKKLVVGELAVHGYPDRKIEFEILSVSPVAEVKDNENCFKVTCKVRSGEKWLKQGMEGVARIELREELYAWIWTRKLVNFVRMQLWF